mmetsp:Transcript_2776/g.6490  ORF Transcript_2776/g.6490 Transcript_2776/m.6490 type:complete len:248 (-) Transcript_2776:98-841(-)
MPSSQITRVAMLASACFATSALKKRHQPMEEGKPGLCACLNWQDVFESGLAQCGDGGELISQGRNLPADTEFCNAPPNSSLTGFYLNQPHEMCINFEKVSGPRKFLEGSWCYVSAACSDLRGGAKLTDKVNWKVCSGKDAKLSDLSPAQLFDLARQNGKSHTVMALMSYTWNEVKGLFPKPPSAKDVAERVAADLGLARVPDKEALTHKPAGHTISWKGQTWEVYPTSAVCVEGCEVEEKEEEVGAA